MNRQEFAAAYREARKVFVFEDAMQRAGLSTGGAAVSLWLAMDDRVWRAANGRRTAWDILLHRYFRDTRTGKWNRQSLSFGREHVGLPGGRA